MNLLFDQNISYRVIRKINDLFPEARQVRELHLENSADISIWEYARKNNFCIVTFDSDFIDLSALKGFPPKIIWLRIGNTSTDIIAEKLRSEHRNILEFLSNSDTAFLEIY